MESTRLQREQIKSESIPCKTPKVGRAAAIIQRWPLTLYDPHSPALRLGHNFGVAHTRLPQTLQAKLTVNEPGDQYEQEADRVAEQVMRMPDTAPLLQRKCGCGGSTASGESCSECASHSRQLQRGATPETSSSPATAPSIVHEVLHAPGQPLDQSTRAFFESRMGHDFGGVRVHTDAKAAMSARAVNALAYTVGRDVVFGEGQFAPGTGTGRQIIAHELSHVVQQRHNQHDFKTLRVGPAHDSFERDAEQHAAWPGMGHAGTSSSAQGPQEGTLQRLGPAAIVALGVGAFATGFGIAWGADYLAMTRERADRYARNLDALYPGWLSALPNCPCTLPCETNTPSWVRDTNPNLSHYHPGAAFSCRSTAAATGGSRHGQQCTYDAARRLITSGAGAGTPDV
jgi:hypothetical protein